MKKILLTAVALLAALLVNAQAEEHIEWNEYYKLGWHDFQGPRMDHSIGDAGTVVEIRAKPYVIKRKVYYDVHAVFNKRKSWATDQSDALLSHEQLHFDIAELYARKIRKRLSEFGQLTTTHLKSYNAAIEKILAESNEVDIRYDIETLHGALSNKQKEWEEKIRKEMVALSDYKKVKRIIGTK